MRKLLTLPREMRYPCQEKAWFDEDVMTEWIEECLGPYVATAPPGIVPFLLLDDFRVHKTGKVVSAIQELGIQVEFIPPTALEWCSRWMWATTSP